MSLVIKCGECDGRGWLFDGSDQRLCPSCDGSGFVPFVRVSDAELAAHLRSGKWTTVDVFEAARRLSVAAGKGEGT